MTCIIYLRFNTPYFFMAHFYMHAPSIQFFNSFFHGGTNITAHSLPVLFLQSLRNRKVLYCFCFTRCFYPKFQFCTNGKFDILNIFQGQIFHTFDFFAICQKSFQFISYVFAGVFQNRARINKFTIVQKEARNAKCTYRTTIFIQVIFIIIYIPINTSIGYHIYTSIIQCGNVHQNDRRTISLYSGTSKKVIIIFNKQFNRYLFICIIPSQINAY